MKFFEFTATITNPGWEEKNEDRRTLRSNTKRIAETIQVFNNNLTDNSFITLVDISTDYLRGCMIAENNSTSARATATFRKLCSKCRLNIDDIAINETLMSELSNNLSHASSERLIYDNEEILDRYELGKLNSYRFGISFKEYLLMPQTKARMLDVAKKYLAADTMVPELNRIFEGETGRKVFGHPVHYMFNTDSNVAAEKLTHTLLEALYANGRLATKRVVDVDAVDYEEISRAELSAIYKAFSGGAVIVRCSVSGGSNGNYASAVHDLAAKIGEVAQKYQNDVLTVIVMPRDCNSMKSALYENTGRMRFVSISENLIYDEDARNYLRTLAKENNTEADDELLSKVEADNGYYSPELNGFFDEWYTLILRNKLFPQYRDYEEARVTSVKTVHTGSAYDELMSMTGLTEAKSVITDAINYFKFQKYFADKGIPQDRTSMHMVFTGNPGTAKTTVARLFAKILKEKNILSVGKLIEVGRGDLVGKYVGWTAPIIQSKFREAKGSVLFIDEAYSLVDKTNSFGDEAINTIVQEMENHRDDVVVIFAGYPDEMEQFLDKNPGLRSRIAFHVPFNDYNADELCTIADYIADKNKYHFTDDAKKKLHTVFETACEIPDFGNGRFARNIFEQSKMAQASRLVSMDFDNISDSDIFTLTEQDIVVPMMSSSRKKASGIGKIGF